jgi:hypothetical protein
MTAKTSYYLYPSAKRLIYPCTHLSFWLNNSLLDPHCLFRQQGPILSDWLIWVEVASLYLFETILFTTSAVRFNFIKRSLRECKNNQQFCEIVVPQRPLLMCVAQVPCESEYCRRTNCGTCVYMTGGLVYALQAMIQVMMQLWG